VAARAGPGSAVSDAGRSDAEPGVHADWLSAGPFLAVHFLPFVALLTGVTLVDATLAAALYLVRMFFVTAGYHRYFSHRSYRLSRPAQLVIALGGVTAAQKGPLWWASHHRRHHRHADTPRDVHSPRRGLWWSHVGWILSRRYKQAERAIVADLAAFPELEMVDRLHWIGPWALGALCYLVAGWGGVAIGFGLSTVLLWHGTFAVNSLAHRIGRRRYATPDDSRNSWLIALVTLGEGWHNNHHHYPPSARQGFRRWEIDVTYYVLAALQRARIVRDLRVPTARVLAGRLVHER